jgi:hypothetical protein
MVRFQHHPDGHIFINELMLPVDFFRQLAPAYSLPDEAIGRIYIPDKAHHIIYDNGGRYESGGLPWPEGDAYIANERNFRTQFEHVQKIAELNREQESEE